MDQIIQDIKYSLRMFGQQRAFTIAAVAALALGIGATTAVFSVINASLLRPFAYPNADRIIVFEESARGRTSTGASPAEFAHYQRQAAVAQDVAAFRSGIVNFTGGDTPEQLKSGQVSEAYFRLFGAKAAIGRTFTADEDRPNGPRVAVISYGWWKRRFGGDPSIVGKTISLSGEPYTVVGVIGQSFDPSEFGPAPDVWTPFQLDPNTNDQGHYFAVAGRLAPGVTIAQAKSKLTASAAEYKARFPNSLGPNQTFTVDGLQAVFVRNSKTLFTILFAAVAGVLLIACANVANLLLVRATVRKREMAIRAAIGAGRGRIVRQLMTESVLLAIMGGVLGLALGVIGIRWLLSINTAGLPRVGEGGSFVHLDWRVLVFTAVVSIGTGLLFGVVPALHAVREDLSGALRESSGSAGGGRNVLRSTLVVVEIALALTLVVGSGLLIRTSMALHAVSPGFDPHNVLVMNMAFTGDRYATSAAVDQALKQGVERLNALPGVEVASAACCVPLQGGYGLPFNIVGKPSGNGPWLGGGDWVTVSPGYFAVFKIPVLRGRAFTDQDTKGAPPVVIINEAMAKQFWKTGDPLSDRLTIGRGIMKEFADEPDRQIIGIVADSRDDGLNQDPQPKMFIPQGQVPDAANALNMRLSPTSWVIRTKVPPLTLSQSVQSTLRQATGLPPSNVQTMDEIVSKSTSRNQFNTLLMTIFATSALLLAAIGIYGVMAYAVQQRTREIGVRLALGAEPGRVRGMVVFQGMRLAITGVVLGLGAAFVLSRYMSSLLFGVQSRDPVVFVGVPVLLAVIALVAVWIPAGRASRIDPLGALRAA